jgi:hypothetical protein
MKAELRLSIGLAGCVQTDEMEIDEDEYNSLETEQQKADYLHEFWVDWIWNHVDGSCEIIED